MKLNKLLERQLKKFLPEKLRQQEDLQEFLAAISNSYMAYERDNEIAARAFRLSEEEYRDVNEKLKNEIAGRIQSVKKLKETIREMGQGYLIKDSDDLIDIVKYLKKQVKQRKEAEGKLLTTANRLSALIGNLQTGILVEDETRHIVLTNDYFCNIFSIPVSPELLRGIECSNSAEESKYLFTDPEGFVSRINELVKDRKLVVNDELEMADGRFLERDYIPVFIDSEYKGHLWKYRDITQHKLALKAIEQSELKNRLIMSSALDAIITIDSHGCITFWNPQAEKIFGHKEQEMLGKKLTETIIPPGYRAAHEKGMDHYRRTKAGPVLNKQIELTAVNKEGIEFPIELSIIPIRQNDTEFFCSFIRDISARKTAEAKLKASEELWQFALEGAGDGVWEYNFKSRKGFLSKQNKKLLGYSDTEFSNDSYDWLTRIHPDDMPVIKKLDADYIAKKIVAHKEEYRVKNREGKYIWILDRAKLIGDETGSEPSRLIGTHTDITKQKETEEELRRLSLVASNNRNGVVFTDREGKIFWVNEGFEVLTGYYKDEIIGKTPVELLQGDMTDRTEMQVMVDNFFAGKNFDVELLCYKRDSSTFYSRTKGQSVYDKDGNVVHYFAVLEDITQEKEAREKNQEFEHRFRKALEKIGDNVWEHDFITGKTYFSNPANLLQGFGVNETTDNAALWWQQVHFDDKAMLLDNDTKYKSGVISDHTLEYRLVRKDGSVRWVLDRGVVIEKTSTNKPLKIVGTHTDITARKLSEQALIINEEKYRSIIANMNLGLLEVDTTEIIQYANQSFCEMCGYELDELIGQKASLLFVKGESSEIIEAKNELRKTGMSDAYEIAVKNKRGELKWWLISGAPRFNDNGDLVGSIGIHLDITEQKNLEIELYEAREAAEQSASAKETFLANMSHEIRTPMNAILGMGRQMNKTKLSDEQHFFLDTINHSAEHLLVVINDILDISKIEAGKLNLEQIGFKPEEVVKHCIQVMSHRAEEKGLRLTMEGKGGRCPVLLGDPYRLTQVLLNLISNAVKFTEKGSVTVRCDLLSPAKGKQVLRVSVKDTGIGMEREFQSVLFRKFTQEDKSIARKYGGTGLGMSISKQLLELMNGSIEVKSEKGKGTEIIIAVPFTIGSIADLPEDRRNIADTAILKGKRILLVEDNEMNRLVATMILRNFGVLISEVENGLEAVNAIRKSAYDLVLMDMQMPVMDGLEATRLIRKEIDTRVPIIALTANAIKGESDKCREAGMNDFVSKPFEEEELVGVIAHWLGREIQPATISFIPTVSTTKLYNLEKLEKISNGNTEFVKKMLQMFKEQARGTVTAIRIALKNNDYPQINALAHRLKPALDSMGIVSLHKTIRDIEKLEGGRNDLVEAEALVQQLETITDLVLEQLNNDTGI